MKFLLRTVTHSKTRIYEGIHRDFSPLFPPSFLPEEYIDVLVYGLFLLLKNSGLWVKLSLKRITEFLTTKYKRNEFIRRSFKYIT